MRAFDSRDLCGCSHSHDFASSIAALRTEIDDVIGALHHFHVVLDDDYRMTLIDQFVKCPEQALDVVKVKACSRLIKDKKGSGFSRSRHMRR